jgi:hypothetical protein
VLVDTAGAAAPVRADAVETPPLPVDDAHHHARATGVVKARLQQRGDLGFGKGLDGRSTPKRECARQGE